MKSTYVSRFSPACLSRSKIMRKLPTQQGEDPLFYYHQPKRGNIKVTLFGSIRASSETLKIKFPRQYSTFIGIAAGQSMLACSLLSISVSERKEDKAMNKKILVLLAQNVRIEEMIPYVDRVARPGMTVVFLVRYPVGGFIWAKEEFGMKVVLEAKKLASYYSWQANLKRAKSGIAPAVEALGRKGVEVTVDVYAGSVKRAVRSHTINADVHIDGTDSVFKWFNCPSFSPVLLINPRTLQ